MMKSQKEGFNLNEELDVSKEKLEETWNQVWSNRNLDLIVKNLRNNLGGDLEELYVHTHAPFVLKEVEKLAPKLNILEAGCGLGQWVFWISERGHNVVGIDVAREAISIAEDYAKKNNFRNCSFVYADLRSIPFSDNSFDYIFSFGVIEHFRNPEEILSEFYRVLKPGGKVFISVPCRYCLHTIKRPFTQMLGLWDVGYECSYSQSALKKLVEAFGFTICECGIMPGEEFFGAWSNYIPFVGKSLYNSFRKLSFYLEKKQKIFGFWIYAVGEK